MVALNLLLRNLPASSSCRTRAAAGRKTGTGVPTLAQHGLKPVDLSPAGGFGANHTVTEPSALFFMALSRFCCGHAVHEKVLLAGDLHDAAPIAVSEKDIQM
jgi:hypothetical protein